MSRWVRDLEGCMGREQSIDEGTEVAQEWGCLWVRKVCQSRATLVPWVEVQYTEPLRARLGAPESHHVFCHATFVN